jgi:endonuclease/exonuclease/phosphatase (EEP) superfamily protein YafD
MLAVWGDATRARRDGAVKRLLESAALPPLSLPPLPVRLICAFLGRAAVLLCFVAALALAAAFRFGDASTWWIELLRYVPYLAWLLPAGLAFLCSWAFGWGWRLLGSLALTLVLGPVMGLTLGLGRVAPAQMPHAMALRVMTYNVKSYRAEAVENAYELLADEITRQAPDVLLVQDGPHLNRPGRLHPALRAALAPYQWQGVGQYVIASRQHALRDCRAGNLPVQGNPWPVLRCTLQVGTRPVTLVDVHTLTPRQGLNATRSEQLDGLTEWRENFQWRMAQVRQLVDDLASMPRPVIAAGDLNAPQHSPVVQALLDQGLRDAYGEAGRGWGYTVGHALRPHLSFLRIDHVLVSHEIGVVDAQVGSRWGSEHRPVIADLLVPQ